MFRRRALTVGQLVRADGEALDRLFRAARRTGRPVGRGAGTILLGGSAVASRVVAAIAAPVWRGKVVDPDGRAVRNLVTPLALPAFRAALHRDRSWVDGESCTVLDYSATSLLTRHFRDEIREVAPDLYLGVVFWGKRLILRFCLDVATGR